MLQRLSNEDHFYVAQLDSTGVNIAKWYASATCEELEYRILLGTQGSMMINLVRQQVYISSLKVLW